MCHCVFYVDPASMSNTLRVEANLGWPAHLRNEANNIGLVALVMAGRIVHWSPLSSGEDASSFALSILWRSGGQVRPALVARVNPLDRLNHLA